MGTLLETAKAITYHKFIHNVYSYDELELATALIRGEIVLSQYKKALLKEGLINLKFGNRDCYARAFNTIKQFIKANKANIIVIPQ
jgi:hypothetical protein